MGCGRRQPFSHIRGGIGGARAGRHSGLCQPEHGSVATNDPYRADRVRECRRPGRCGLCREVGAPRRQRHRIYAFEYSLSGKWLELLKEIAPNLTRIAILRDPAIAAGIGQFAAIQAMASPSLGVELSPIDVRDGGEIERNIAALAREPSGGLIMTASTVTAIISN